MKQSENLQNGITKKLIKDVTWEQIQEIMRPKIEKLQAQIRPKQPIIYPKSKAYTDEELDEIKKIIHKDTRQILETLQRNSFLYKTRLLKEIGVHQNKFDASLAWLLKNRFIEEVKCKTGQTQPGRFYPLTERAHDFLGTPQHKRKPTPRMFRHTYYCLKVAACLKKQGYVPKPEYRPVGMDDFFETQKDGRGIKILQRIDVFAKQEGRKVAYEITLSFDNLILNVYKCFLRLDMDELHIVCEKAKGNEGMEKAEKIINESVQLAKIREHHSEHIHYRLIKEFL